MLGVIFICGIVWIGLKSIRESLIVEDTVGLVYAYTKFLSAAFGLMYIIVHT